MLTSESAEYFYQRLADICEADSQPIRARYLNLRLIMRDAFSEITKDENQLFSSLFARTVFIIDKFTIPEELSSKIKCLRTSLARLKKNKSIAISAKELFCGAAVLAETIRFLSGSEMLPQLEIIHRNYYKLAKSQSYDTGQEQIVHFVRAIVKSSAEPETASQSKIQTSQIICETSDFGIVTLILSGIWIDTSKVVRNNSVLNLFDCRFTPGDNPILYTTSNTLIVLEPDYLVDVTELSECFQNNSSNTNLYILKKFLSKKTKYEAVAGNLVNYCFDRLLENPGIDFETSYYDGLKVKPLQVIALAFRDKNSVRQLREMVSLHFENLRNVLATLQYDGLSLEPTFLSAGFGLQGRLDALIEFDEEPNRKNIIELKSGKAPNPDYSIRNYDGNIVRSGVWLSNLAQITCYNLLLDSNFQNRTGSSQILYSSAGSFPFRNAPNIIQKKQEVMLARNRIIAAEQDFYDGNFTILNSFKIPEFGDLPKFNEEDIISFYKCYSMASPFEKEYFHRFIQFVTREIRASKLGSGNNSSGSGFSALWKDSLEEKESSLSALPGLELCSDDSDWEQMHLVFRKPGNALSTTSLRRGDLAIIYKVTENSSSYPLNQQLLKCSIKEIDNTQIKISLRNKLLRKNYFEHDCQWVLEPDYLDALNKTLFSSLYAFLSSDKDKRNILLGLRQPLFDDFQKVQSDELNEQQKCYLESCLAAKDYFILQGPPGTGKTSFMLKAIVRELFFGTDENILVLAYTNRAVDEICSALKKIEGSPGFLRLGAKESSEHTDSLISCLAEKNDMNWLFKKIKETRIIVSTVSSVLANHEVFEIKSYNTAIIDEASQILEPQLVGILTKVQRFIMIGDEKQLPAVVVQNVLPSSDNLETVNGILENPGRSLFERLLKCCKANGWTDAYGMLSYQARMHTDIQELVNKLFYGGRLHTFGTETWQVSSEQDFSTETGDSAENLLASSRLIFIESERETTNKINHSEAKLAGKLIEKIAEILGDKFTDRTLGVITPFRAQCSEILANLNPGLRKMVSVDTVERFQGSERDIIIISFAVNHEYLLNNTQSLVEIDGVLVDRKLNVALTRAKKHIILLGCPEILMKSGVFSELIQLFKLNGRYISLRESNDLLLKALYHSK